MLIDSPVISVIMITFNHEKYIEESIKSVLSQTFTNFELIIVNDGSIDRTGEIIRGFSDARIIYLNQENQGPSSAINRGILESRGKYIALFSGDDVLYPYHLEKQYIYLKSMGAKIVFSWVDFIDDDSQLIEDKHFAQDFFNHPNRSRAEILNHFFFKGNYLCAVTAFVEKSVLLEFLLFNPSSIQLQDFQMWISIITKYDIFIQQDKLVKYRIRSGSGNLSSPANAVRSTFEAFQVYKSMLDCVSIDLFKESFREHIKRNDFVEGIEYELEKAFLYLSHDFFLFRSIGVERLFLLLQSDAVRSLARSKYKFCLPDLYKLSKEMDITNSKIIQQTQSQLQQTQSQLQQTQSQLQQTQSQLQQTQSQLQKTEEAIAAMETSKFWKARQVWFQIKQLVDYNIQASD
jgi:glycosyltransferase involved in cell wall biosynthesis